MSKLLLLAVLFAPVVHAQEATSQKTSRAPVIENTSKPVLDEQFCVYEDKKYSEGSLKSADGRTMICMAKESFGNNEPRELYWEFGSSLRGERHLRPAAPPKR